MGRRLRGTRWRRSISLTSTHHPCPPSFLSSPHDRTALRPASMRPSLSLPVQLPAIFRRKAIAIAKSQTGVVQWSPARKTTSEDYPPPNTKVRTHHTPASTAHDGISSGSLTASCGVGLAVVSGSRECSFCRCRPPSEGVSSSSHSAPFRPPARGLSPAHRLGPQVSKRGRS